MTDLEIELGRKALAHLLSMPSQAIDTFFDEDSGEEISGGCRYRAESGSRCAVGAIIPDDLYSDEIEGWPSKRVLPILESHFGAAFSKEFYKLCDKLQSLHDNEAFWTAEGFRPLGETATNDLREIRKKLNLPLDNPPEI